MNPQHSDVGTLKSDGFTMKVQITITCTDICSGRYDYSITFTGCINSALYSWVFGGYLSVFVNT